MQSLAQCICPRQLGSGERIWVRKDNPLTHKEDWGISQALMSPELVFISHHKKRAVCVTARARQYDHRVSESTGIRQEDREEGGKEGGEEG